MLAYLVIREGSNWTDVIRLTPGQSFTIGRSPTNHIVIKSERCSREHAEVFQGSEGWTVRDLDSRNGTYVHNERITGDVLLDQDDIIRIGGAQLKFVRDVSKAFPESARLRDGDGASADSEGMSVLDDEPTHITHRAMQTKFLSPQEVDEEEAAPKVGRAAAALCRLAFDLAQAPDLPRLAEIALAGLFNEVRVDSGALLLLPKTLHGDPEGSDLEIVASRTDIEDRYHRLSSFLGTTVLREGEAVLARNVIDDSVLGGRDSQGEIHATSVICAPIRRGGRLLGLVHLYSTQVDVAPDPDDLEFTLAVAETIGVAIDNLNRREELAENLSHVQVENVQLRERLGVESEIVGSSLAMQRVSQEIVRAAPSRATVLIRGESGVGKELVARAVHYASPRAKQPFVCLNCAALSETLLESELFGHEKGAFTGATERKIGKFEAAHEGTLMLDEIGEMSPGIQAKFLRVLEGHAFERVGGSQPISVDVRVIAATNRDLEKEVAEGNFRRDLYFRLHVVEIFVPALRKRPEDIHELAAFFLQKYNEETGRRIRGFTPDALEAMRRYRWPGNVREMKNVIERAVVLARDDELDIDDLTLSNLSTAGDTVDPALPVDQYEPMSLAEMEQIHVLATLRATGWNKSRAASILGIERSTLDRKIRRYELVNEGTRRAR
ncbi:MAG: FHA domain-containing protein [Planctomycetota bacterium]|nr:MAG: FHA domain-containing protein [Planctomycetota bacterium]REJ98779.1 MAG: FHA domain-containing protein [Planctomycetota bacterium]REK27624.1 MAG: FHA domain-containing protein [Planctomycetota bacterium]REK43235.1 MAG: FHA domain-containing protein [Planctomycetota bacterium]